LSKSMNLTRRGFIALASAGGTFLTPTLLLSEETFYDYLKRTGRDATFASRRELWMNYRPAEKFTGTAEQNTALYAAVKLFDKSPQFELSKQQIAKGADVLVTVPEKELLIESELLLQSFQTGGETEVSLGKANAANTYTVRVSDGIHDARAILALVPNDNAFSVSVLGASAIAPQLPAVSAIQPKPEVAAVLAKFWDEISGDLFGKAFSEVWPGWLTENTGTLGETLIVCTIGTPIACGIAGGAHGLNLVATTFKQLAEHSTTLSPAEKSLLIDVLDIGDTATQMAASMFGLKQRKKFCTLAAVGMAGVDSYLGTVEKDGVRVTARLLLQSTKKFTAVLCAKKL
jgi:hypothetical protein